MLGPPKKACGKIFSASLSKLQKITELEPKTLEEKKEKYHE